MVVDVTEPGNTLTKELGEAIEALRRKSRFHSRKDFARQAGLSEEGLRKIENGYRVPAQDTLDKIVKVCVATCPQEETTALYVLRDQAQATRDGINLGSRVSTQNYDLATKRVLDFVETTILKPNDMFIGQKERNVLIPQLREVIRESIS